MIRFAILSLLFLATPAQGVAQEPATEFELQLESPQEKTVLPDVPHHWRLALDEGQFAEVKVAAPHAKVALRLIDPAGSEQDKMERNYAASGGKFRWIAEVAGNWQIEVAAGDGKEQAAYTIQWITSRAASDGDRKLVAADRRGQEAETLFEQGTYDQAEPLMRQVLESYEEVFGPEHLEVADALNALGTVSMRMGRYAAAEPYYQRALTIREKLLGLEHSQVADTVGDLAVLFWNQGRYAEAESYYKRQAAIDEKMVGPDHPDLANSLNNLGVLYWRQGRYREAQALYERSLDIRERSLGPDDEKVATSINNLAVLFESQGRLAEAEPLFIRVLEIDRKNVGPEHPLLAWSLDGLAAHYRAQARYDEAEPLHRQALAIREKALGPEHPLVASSLNSLGVMLNLAERYDEAEPLLRRALEVQEKSLGPSHVDVAYTLKNLAYTFIKTERYAEAEPLLTRALEISEQSVGPDHPDVAQGLIALAEIAAKRQLPETALPLLDRAIKILDQAAGYAEDRIQAYADRARILKKMGRADEALDDLEESLLAAEEMRPHTGGGEATRAALFERYSDEFSRMVSWQVEAGDFEAALEYAERGRARVLLDQLQAGKIDLRAGIPKPVRERLEEREAAAQALMAEYQQRITLMRGRTDIPGAERGAMITELSEKLKAAHAEFSRVYAEIKDASPLWRDLITSGGKPADLRQLQRQLVPEEGLLLLYQLGPEASHLFVIGSRRGDLQVLPLTVGPEEAELLGHPPGPLTTKSLAGVLGSDMGLFFGPSGMIEPLQEQLHGLWLVLVPESIRERVLDSKEVVLVPDGALRNLPFEALLIEAGETWEKSKFWLDEGPPIRYSPSATALLNIQQRPAANPMGQSQGPLLLTLADPLYDPMATDEPAEPTGESRGLIRNAYLRAGGPLVRLPGTARESDMVISHFGRERTVDLREAEATEANLRSSIQGRRFLHLATHGLVDEHSGSLFAALALTPPVDEKVSAANDGFLQLYEIYELNLTDAELAVLSACETSVGSEVGGEGVFALSRGFLAAGARRVISSHWAVDDASTAELIGTTFATIADAELQGAPLDYTAALREAKRSLRRRPEWNAPFFWAPFTLTGKR